MEATRVAFIRGSRRTRLLAGSLALVLGMASAPAAHAQGSGVVFEPGTPSDKEYAIPLEEARRDAGGGRPGVPEAAAFGIGLSRKGRSPDAGRSGGGASSQDSGRSRGERTPADSTGGSRASSPGFTERLAEAESAGAPSTWKLGPFLLVLLPALVVGVLLALRGRGRPAAT